MTKAKKTKFLKAIGENKHLEQIREFLQKLNTAALASREATQTERAIRKIQYSLDNADKAQADARSYLELIPEDIQKKLMQNKLRRYAAITSASFERGKEWIVEAAPSIKQSFIALPTRIRSLLLSKTSNWICKRSA